MGQGKKFLAELIGTFTLIFFGAGAILTHNATQMVGMTGIAVAHGLAILVMIYAFGAVSGGHFNPAVTFGFLVARRIGFGGAISYWIAQLVGASLAAWVLLRAWHGPTEAHLGTPAVAAGVSPMLAMCLEGLMAFMLVIVIFGSAVDPRASKGFAGLAIGLTLVGNILVPLVPRCYPVTGRTSGSTGSAHSWAEPSPPSYTIVSSWNAPKRRARRGPVERGGWTAAF
jgi:glycerol uptake facilitator-like aquaporin